MNKIAVIYWSGTGNTEAMAKAIAEGSGGDLYTVSDITPAKALEYDKIAFGCPAMGSEVLEEAEFDPFFTEVERKLGGKKIALFGSYGWGDGEWMRQWYDRADSCGALLFGTEVLIVNDAPGDAERERCKKFGAEFSAF